MSTIVSFYNLSGLTITPTITCDQPLDPEYWNPDDSPIPPSLTQTRPLVVNRDIGITYNKTFNFTITLPLTSNGSLGFMLTLLGKDLIKGSDMSQSFMANGEVTMTWDTNDSNSCTYQVSTDVGTYTLNAFLVTRFGATFSDVILTLSNSQIDPGVVYYVGQQWFTPAGLIGLTLTQGGFEMTRAMYGTVLWAPPIDEGCIAYSAQYHDGTSLLTVYDQSGNAHYSVQLANPPQSFSQAQLMSTPDLQVSTFEGNTNYYPSPLGLPAIDWSAFVFLYSQAGYQFSETSEYWKMMCQLLPCCLLLQWPGYQTAKVDVVLNGQPAVIQVWRGHCQRFLGDSNFPGGYGAEVGVYNLDGWGSRSSDNIPNSGGLSQINSMMAGSDDIWYPAPQLVEYINFDMVNPNSNEVFFSSEAQNTYWNCKWMEPDSYELYKRNQNGNYPNDDIYILRFTVNNQQFIWPIDGDIQPTTY